MNKIKIKYYDKNIIIIYKPIGVEVINLLKIKIKNKIPNKGILNRLDKYTSGIILIARNIYFYFFYKKMLIKNYIKKIYISIIKKNVKKGFINLNILKKKKNIINKIGKKSLTFYKILKKRKNNSIILIYIKTGRTHQIRNHFFHCKLNIINDFYNNKINKFLHTLHYKKISFFYPVFKKNFILSCNIPIEMKKIFLIFFLK
ncbi:MAG: pseudouridine synthase [Candidatus Carsonella ruddii]